MLTNMVPLKIEAHRPGARRQQEDPPQQDQRAQVDGVAHHPEEPAGDQLRVPLVDAHAPAAPHLRLRRDDERDGEEQESETERAQPRGHSREDVHALGAEGRKGQRIGAHEIALRGHGHAHRLAHGVAHVGDDEAGALTVSQAVADHGQDQTREREAHDPGGQRHAAKQLVHDSDSGKALARRSARAKICSGTAREL
jgi:hypothetical protein